MNDPPPRTKSTPPSHQDRPSAVVATSSQPEASTTASGPSNSNIANANSTDTTSSSTPTSFAAPPSTSAAAALDSAGPHHHVPDYVSRQSPSSADMQPPSSSSTPVASAVRQPSSMNPSSSSVSYAAFGHEPPASQPLRSTSSQQQHQEQQPHGSHSTPASSRIRPTVHAEGPVGRSASNSPSNRIKVRDLSHVQSFAKAEFHAQVQGESEGGVGQRPPDRQYEISSMPTADVIEMVAGLLTKITATNDVHHNDMQIPPPEGTASLSPQATSVLAFHGKNVPAISILSYLTRINKYCPTTYEVFISLLIYFDRMTDLVNRGHLDRVRHHWGGYPVADPGEDRGSEQQQQQQSASKTNAEAGTKQPSHASPMVTPPSSTGMTARDPSSPSISPSLRPHPEGEAFSHFFVVDSYNIHRLVIAGVTCASKFFSDVFYTNSRYAKVWTLPSFIVLNPDLTEQVGGLPLVELNHLELQFLLLNDFRLSIPVEELEAYGTMLVEFYAREMLSTQAAQDAPLNPPLASIRHPEVRQTPTPP